MHRLLGDGRPMEKKAGRSEVLEAGIGRVHPDPGASRYSSLVLASMKWPALCPLSSS